MIRLVLRLSGILLVAGIGSAQSVPSNACDTTHQQTILVSGDQTEDFATSNDGATFLELRLRGNAVVSMSKPHSIYEKAEAKNYPGKPNYSTANAGTLSQNGQTRKSFVTYDQGCIDSLTARIETNEKTLLALQASILTMLKGLPTEIVRSKTMQNFKKQILREAAEAAKGDSTNSPEPK